MRSGDSCSSSGTLLESLSPTALDPSTSSILIPLHGPLDTPPSASSSSFQDTTSGTQPTHKRTDSEQWREEHSCQDGPSPNCHGEPSTIQDSSPPNMEANCSLMDGTDMQERFTTQEIS